MRYGNCIVFNGDLELCSYDRIDCTYVLTLNIGVLKVLVYDTGVTAAYGDKLITLSTCEKGDSSRRVVVVAKRIQ